MVDIEKYKLTEEDIKNGIEDFLTQILIEARRQKGGTRKIEELSSEQPMIVYTIGQPGSGKTSLGKFIQRQYEDRGESLIEINSDKIATYHKYYNEILKLLPDECYTLSRQFVSVAEPEIYKSIKTSRINVIQEASFAKGEKDYAHIQGFKDSGYSVEINIMAVDKYESFLSCIERDIKLLELGYDPRPVARVNHDRMYEPFLQELSEIEKRGLCDKMNVYIRGQALNIPELVYSTGDSNYSSAQEAVIAERAKSRRKIISEPQRYLSRLSTAKSKINMMILDERLKSNYLEGINQLEKEFYNEMSFEKSI